MRIAGTTHFDEPSLYIASEEHIFLMIQTGDIFLKDYHKPSPFHAWTYFKRKTALLDELHVCHFEQDQEKCPSFALLHRTKIISHSTILLFIRAIPPFA